MTSTKLCVFCKQPVDDQPGFVCLGCQRDQAYLDSLVDDLWNDACEVGIRDDEELDNHR